MSEFSCGYCQKSFNTLTAMKDHVASKHVRDAFPAKSEFKIGSDGQIPPKGNGRTNWALSSVTGKGTAEPEFRCFPCGLDLCTETLLKRHIEEEHRSRHEVVDVEIVTESLPIKRSKRNFKTGVNRCKVDDADVMSCVDGESLPDDDDAAVETVAAADVLAGQASTSASTCWSCSACDKTFRFKSRLERHRIIHRQPPDVERRFECDVCQKKFLRSGDLWAHKKIHTDEKYECKLCGKKLASSGALHNHRISFHRPETDRLKCSECPKTFSLKQKLRTHQLTKHGGDLKPFRCEICDKSFARKESLTAHCGSIHGQGDPVSCRFCSKPFYDRDYLKKHLKWHQNKKKMN